MDRFTPRPYVTLTHPAWSKDAAIYQVNVRQFTEAGTLASATEELPRIADLGARIVWLMPIHEIGGKERKGELGSPYAVRDYYSVSSELGSLDDLKHFVSRAHSLGLYVILDWVANHTAWDNVLVDEHPEWYARTAGGEFRSTPWWDWSDVIDLDYEHRDLRQWMIEAMAYWIREVDVDGFRCDVAGYVPTDFWVTAREVLEEIKPVFMLAEWEARDLHAAAFDMTYAWSWYKAMADVCQGKAGMEAVLHYYASNTSAFPRDGYRMLFVSNHDINAWEATEFEAFGPALEAIIVLSVASEGMPLIYNGQEAGHDKQLAFFDRDPIAWRPHPMAAFYKRLFHLKQRTPALWNGKAGAPMVQVKNDQPEQVFSFYRADQASRVFAAFNLSAEEVSVNFDAHECEGSYTNFADDSEISLAQRQTVNMPAWSWLLYVSSSG